ncbi:MAG TPA: hypothetical protein VJP80_00215 [Candidatus Saccharimonadales bacterium]|nr:hypothetical protein [Candidatus Saccharimonadales bacterium]
MKNSVFRQFTLAYMEAALWFSTNEAGDSLDGLSTKALAPETRREMIRDCRDFYRNQLILLRETIERRDAAWELHGHDFWLTRNRHGAGFWDRGYGSAGEALSAAARVYGGRDLYVGDDGKVYQL